MKKIVVFTGAYYPVPSANGVCLKRILEQINDERYEIHVICHRQDSVEDDTIIDNGIFIHFINLNRYHKLSVALNNSRGKKRFLIKLCLLFMKAINVFRYPLTSKYEVDEYVNKYMEIAGDESNSIAMAVFNPIDAVYALLRLKERARDVLAIGIYFDSLSNEGEVGILPSKIRNKLVYNLEYRLFKHNDLVIQTESHKNHYTQSLYKDLENRFRYIREPLLDSQLNVWNVSDVKKNTFLYAGALSKERRNPKVPFETILKSVPESVINYYGYSDCEEMITNISIENNNRIIKKGRVPHETVIESMKSTEYLLSIGNRNSDMTPSKIFEYISTGKPIVHFYYDDKDTCVKLLNQYDNAVCIKMDEELPHIEEVLKEFCSTHKTHIPYEQIKKDYFMSDPVYTSEIILTWIDDNGRK